MLRDPLGSVADPHRKRVTYVVSSGTPIGLISYPAIREESQDVRKREPEEEPRDMSGEARLLLHEKLQQKTRFLLPDKEVAIWPLEDFPKNNEAKYGFLVSAY